LPALATALAESLRRGELDDVQLATVRCVRTAGQTQLQALERAVDDFDFDTAIALLDELSRTTEARRPTRTRNERSRPPPEAADRRRRTGQPADAAPCLQDDYRLFFARDGVRALELAAAESPA
jgi:uncharacterized protein involved in type VI secretion and phage assembly